MTDTITSSPISTRPPIQRATPDDVPAIARTLAAAFRDDPVFTWCVPDRARRIAVLPGFFELIADPVLAHGEAEVSPDGEAAALWVLPGRPPVPEAETPDFEARLAGLLGVDAERTFTLMALLDEHHPVDDHRFLWFLGVTPRRQGHGLGSSLLASTLDRCDREGVAAYLDATSEHNRRLYERHGFTVVAERSVDGSPPLWAMWRDPR